MEWSPEKIRQLRKRLGMTQNEFAKRLGYSRQATVSDLENGRQKPSGSVEQILSLLDNSEEDQSNLTAETSGDSSPSEGSNSPDTWTK